tara:strand:+ start:144 stop:446 length:303 start_codon:yes stop_codon:yes gene_type:complete
MKLRIENSKAKNKRFVAIFTDKNNKEKRVNFGLKNPKIGTYIDHQDKDIRRRYRARHEPPEKKFYGNPQKPSTLSRFILWGEAQNLQDAIKDYKKKFNLS